MKAAIKLLVITVGVTLFFGILYKITIPRIAAFGCFDDCFNFGAGFFLTKGKHLYSEIFFNHQPLPSYISAAIQQITNPVNIYELLLRHRQFVLMFALFSNIVLIFRFGYPAVLFMFLFELTKFYIFGDRFLAEGIIVYPFVFMCGAIWNQFHKQYSVTDSLGVVLCATFIFFMREPYIPAALFLLFISLQRQPRPKKILYILFFLTVMGIPFLFLPIKEYIFNVFTINQRYILPESIRESNVFGIGLVTSFFYPVLLFFGGSWTIFRYITLFIASVFLISSYLYTREKRNIAFFIICFITLGLLNLRVVPPGQMFYGSFHLLPWYGVFIFTTIIFIYSIAQTKKITGYLLTAGILLSIAFSIISPHAFFYEKIDRQVELVTNYSEEIKIGNVLKNLSLPSDTIFLDGWAELIYWQANRVSPYKYIWYTSLMPLVPLYARAREEMFTTRPPDFYYGTCPKEQNSTRKIPILFQGLYTNILSEGKPTCLWIKTEKLATISEYQWSKAKELLYDRP